MFSILRFILVVGVIFYYSPVRQQGEGSDVLSSVFKGTEDDLPAAPQADRSQGRLETLWQALPEGAKQVVVDRILTTSGFGATDAKASDTLRAEDRQPVGQSGAAKPRG